MHINNKHKNCVLISLALFLSNFFVLAQEKDIDSIVVDTLINKKLLAANEIFRFIRKGNILELNKLNNMNAEVLEFLVNKDSKVKGKKIRDLDFPRSAIIGGVIRDGVGKIALGDFVIKKGDRILVCALYNAISKVEKLFL